MFKVIDQMVRIRLLSTFWFVITYIRTADVVLIRGQMSLVILFLLLKGPARAGVPFIFIYCACPVSSSSWSAPPAHISSLRCPSLSWLYLDFSFGWNEAERSLVIFIGLRIELVTAGTLQLIAAFLYFFFIPLAEILYSFNSFIPFNLLYSF